VARLYEIIASVGLIACTSHLAVQVEAADQEKAEQLRLAPGSPLVIIERVRTADGPTVAYSPETRAAANSR